MNLDEFKNRTQSEGIEAWDKPAPPFEQFWCFEVKGSTTDIWSFLSDTSRFNRDLGLSPRKESEINGLTKVSTTLIGLKQEWVETPWSWVSLKGMRVERIYSQGAARSMHAVFFIDSGETPDSEHGVRRVYIYFGWHPKNFLWGLFFKLTSHILMKNFAKVFGKIEQRIVELSRSKDKFLKGKPPELASQSLQKLTGLQATLLKRGVSIDLSSRLLDLIRNEDDLDVSRLRVKALAESWKMSWKTVLVGFLHGVKVGLFNITWDAVCPHCRGSRFSAKSLGEIPEISNCDVCDVQFTTDKVESIEVTFRIHPSIRKVEDLAYCTAEPAKKSHLKVQRRLAESETYHVTYDLGPGPHRIRYAGINNPIYIERATVMDAAAAVDKIIVSPATSGKSFLVGPRINIEVTNMTPEAAIFVLEEMVWDDRALRPSDVFSVKEFADLFSEEHLASNVKLSLGEHALMFTDIVGSTRFYQKEGDAKAFQAVRDHFQKVFKVIESHDGYVVKTIGDAVMAAFSSSEDAIKAAIEIQSFFHEHQEQTSIRLRISVHQGPVIAVHLQSGIDYFGATVNFAAKIQAFADAGQIAVSLKSYSSYKKTGTYNFKIEHKKYSATSEDFTPVFVINVTPSAERMAA